jgi:hypothetical protein
MQGHRIVVGDTTLVNDGVILYQPLVSQCLWVASGQSLHHPFVHTYMHGTFSLIEWVTAPISYSHMGHCIQSGT